MMKLSPEQESTVNTINAIDGPCIVICPRMAGKTTMALWLAKANDNAIWCANMTIKQLIDGRGMEHFGMRPSVFTTEHQIRGIHKPFIVDELGMCREPPINSVVAFTSNMQFANSIEEIFLPDRADPMHLMMGKTVGYYTGAGLVVPVGDIIYHWKLYKRSEEMRKELRKTHRKFKEVTGEDLDEMVEC